MATSAVSSRHAITEDKDPSHQCRYERQGGTRCRANAQTESAFCFIHDPALDTERTAARRAGGIARTRKPVLPQNLPNKQLQTAAQVVDLLGETINQVRRGELDLRISNAIGYLSGILLSAIEKSAYEERLAALEASVTTHSVSPNFSFDEESFEFAQKSAGDASCPS